jgi:hypothetical protein
VPPRPMPFRARYHIGTLPQPQPWNTSDSVTGQLTSAWTDTWPWPRDGRCSSPSEKCRGFGRAHT